MTSLAGVSEPTDAAAAAAVAPPPCIDTAFIAPDATVDDGVLEVVIIGNINVLHYLRFLPQLKRSEKIIHPEVHYFKTNQIEFLSTGKLERDGEPGIDTPAAISLQPKSIQVLV